MKTPSAPRGNLDSVDRRILKRMLLDARVQNRDLAAAVDFSASGCLSRVRRLEESGVIQRYITDIDETAFAGWIVMWGELTLTAAGRSAQEAFEVKFHQAPEIVEVRRLVGRADYLMRICARDVSDWTPLLNRLDPDGVFIRDASVQVEAGLAKRFSGLPQLD